MSEAHPHHRRLTILHSVFIRCFGKLTDKELLSRFGLGSYRPSSNPHRLRRYAALADVDGWTMIADDLFYTLWHLPTTRAVISTLGQTWDVFAMSVGDSDKSFDFAFYTAGKLMRSYAVIDPDYSGGRVAENVGDSLPGEVAAFEQDDELKIVFSVAASLGITTHYTVDDVRVYSPVTEDFGVLGG